MKTMLLKYLNRETVAYLICGGFTTIAGLGSYALCDWMGMNVAASNTLSTVLAVALAFVLNKVFVFRSHSWHIKKLLRELLSFCAGRLVTYLMETGLLILMVDYFNLPSLLCKGFTMVLVVITNYIISKWAVFRK